MLLPCYKNDCVHPICVAGRPDKESLWFVGGPPLSYLPLPIPDPHRSWGKECEICFGSCVGHYLSAEKRREFVKANGPGSSVLPPREILKEFAKEVDGFSEEDVQSFASVFSVKMMYECGYQKFKVVERMLRQRTSRQQPGKPRRRGRQTEMNKQTTVSFRCKGFYCMFCFRHFNNLLYSC